jgi:hypothetical protein
MGYRVSFQYMYAMYDNEIKVISISITLDINHFFVLETIQILPTSYIAVLN